MTKIKICGLKSKEDISYVNELLPEYAGFVFAPKSSRYLTYTEAHDLRNIMNPSIKAVGVFVNEPLQNIISAVNDGIIQLIQLHGDEDEIYLASLKSKCSCPIIKAFSIKSKEDVEKAISYPSDYLLLDGSSGGVGQSFNWLLTKELNRPFFLAGGLGPENVSEAILLSHPYAVDVSSGVETDGKKDYNKIKSFINTVRQPMNGGNTCPN